MQATYCMEIGHGKVECEDSICIGKAVPETGSGSFVLESPCCIAILDGVGGNAGGHIASRFVANALPKVKQPLSCEEARKAIESAHYALLEQAAAMPQFSRMATTMTALFFSEDMTILAHIGNTRLYAFRNGCLQQITTDQTTYQWLVDIGETEVAKRCNRSEIRAAIGGGKADYIRSLCVERVFERRLPQTLLLTTDGVHDHLSQEAMEEILQLSIPDEEKCRILCADAQRNGSTDDRSAILLRTAAFAG